MNEKGEWKGLISLSGDGRVASHQASPRVQYVCSIHYSAPCADREALTMVVTCVKWMFNLQVTNLWLGCSAVPEGGGGAGPGVLKFISLVMAKST